MIIAAAAESEMSAADELPHTLQLDALSSAAMTSVRLLKQPVGSPALRLVAVRALVDAVGKALPW